MSTKGQQKLWFFGGVLLVLGLCVGAAWVLVNGRSTNARLAANVRQESGEETATSTVLSAGVSTTPIPTAPPQTVEVTVEVLPPQPSATPAPCTPLSAGMRVEMVPESEAVFTMRLAGFQPGDALIIQFTGSAKDESAQIESIPAAVVSPDGEFQTHTFDLGIYNAITVWQGKVIHSRGAACFDISLPLHSASIIFEAELLEPGE